MRLFTAKHSGHYPIGACSVIVAKDSRTARRILTRKLGALGIKNAEIFRMSEVVDLTVEQVYVLNDGQY